MTIRELLYIKTIIDKKSISNASKELFVAQPSLSQLIKKLENTLGTPLFIRKGNKLVPTYAGECYYQMATEIINTYDNFQTEISNINNLKTGKIKLGITNYLGASLLPEFLPKFHKLYPLIEISIYEKNSTDLEDDLLKGQLDLVIMHNLPENSNDKIHYQTIAREPFLILMNKNNPISTKFSKSSSNIYPEMDIKKLDNQDFIMVHKEQGIRRATDLILSKANITPHILYTLKNFYTVQLLISNGLGVTLLPQRYLKMIGNDNNVSCFSINKEYGAYWDLSLCTPKKSNITRATEMFIDVFQKNIK